jgi:hypothetical protein
MACAMTVVALSYPELRAVPIILAYTLLSASLVLPYAALSSRRLSVPGRPTKSACARRGPCTSRG